MSDPFAGYRRAYGTATAEAEPDPFEAYRSAFGGEPAAAPAAAPRRGIFRRLGEAVTGADPGESLLAQMRENRGRAAEGGQQALRGLAESGYATAEGIGALGNRLTGTNHVDLEELRRNREEMRAYYGDAEGTGQAIAQGTGRIVGDLAQFMAPGAAAGRAGIVPTITAGGARGLAARTAVNTAVSAPITVAQAAGSPENSATGALADLTGNPTLERLSSTMGGRVAGDLAMDAGLSGAVEGAVSAVRAFRGIDAAGAGAMPGTHRAMPAAHRGDVVERGRDIGRQARAALEEQAANPALAYGNVEPEVVPLEPQAAQPAFGEIDIPASPTPYGAAGNQPQVPFAPEPNAVDLPAAPVADQGIDPSLYAAPPVRVTEPYAELRRMPRLRDATEGVEGPQIEGALIREVGERDVAAEMQRAFDTASARARRGPALDVPPATFYGSDPRIAAEGVEGAPRVRMPIPEGLPPEALAALEEYRRRTGGFVTRELLESILGGSLGAAGGAALGQATEGDPLGGALVGGLLGGGGRAALRGARGMDEVGALGLRDTGAASPLDGTRVVDELGQPRRVYHGSGRVFDQFDPQRLDEDALYGPGLYWTEDPKTAGGDGGQLVGYANARGGPQALERLAEREAFYREEMGLARAGQPSMHSEDDLRELLADVEAERARMSGDDGARPNVRTARLAIRRPFDVDAKYRLGDLPPAVQRAVREGWTRLSAVEAAPSAESVLPGEQVYHALARRSKAAANQTLKEAGFDGITHIGGGRTGNDPHRVWIAFDGEQVRSPWGDPRLAERYGFASREALTATLGGTAGAATGAALDDDNRLRGAALGGIAGAGLPVAAGLVRDGLRARGGFDLPPNVDAAMKRAESRIDYQGVLAKRAARQGRGTWGARFERFLDAVATGQGEIERIGDASNLRPTQNPRDLLSLWKGWNRTAARAFYEGVPDPITRAPVGPSLRQVVAPLGDDPDAIRQAFTYAINERLLARGVSAFGGDAKQYADAAEIAQHMRTNPLIAEFTDGLRAYIDGLGNYAVRSGLWSPEQWDAMRESDALYIPIKRIMGPMVQGGARTTTVGGPHSLANVTPGVREFTGSAREMMDPATALADYTANIIRRADSYRVGAAVIEAVDAMGPAGEVILTPVPRAGKKAAQRRAAAAARARATEAALPPDVLEMIDDLAPTAIDNQNPVVWRNGPGGRDERLVNAPDLLRALTALNHPEDTAVRQLLDITLGTAKRVFTATTTGLAPAFSLGTNLVRDPVDLLTKTRNAVRPSEMAAGIADAIGGAAGRQNLDRRLKDFGLGNVTVWNDAAGTNTRAMQREVAPTTRGQRAGAKARRFALNASGITVLEAVGNTSESWWRNAEARASMRQNAGRVESGEWTMEDLLLRAATEGRAPIDYTNRPANQVLRELANYVPFFGAALQGTATFARATKRNPKRVAAVAAGLSAAATMAWVAKHRSEETLARENDRLPAERAAFLYFPIDERGLYTIRVPLTQELAIVAAGVTAGLDAWADQEPHAADVFVEATLRALPPGAGELFQGNVTVPIPGVQQMIENAKNKTDFGGRPVESREMQSLPVAERRSDATPYTADLLAAGARGLGFEDTSPAKADNILRGLTSRYTPMITAVTDPIARRLMGREELPPRIPPSIARSPLNPLSGILANPNPSVTASSERYYDKRETAMQADAALRTAIENGDAGMAERQVEAFMDPEVAALSGGVREATDDIAKQFTQAQELIRTAYAQGAISEQAAQEAMEELKAARAMLMREVMQAVGNPGNGGGSE